ncbi:hypothetical protein BGZ61DRAFT_471380 [Ilyonectria robusta]|uniref:uncharacterized protein n=1 Tax=Ilyonectria robusta TaxID=1079257 RepID=UPI001E8CA163|nr:uncharacterized protein BGZ61DRAFT_471380 [Ilyonectria robusta]KAH6998772.1 hypothetical protein BKA56DRAFT_665321 [Ilyonectria sp. MPI-CAGE-AT-0026]KAH8738007.1 hypothetical protein BGZ61DRAFT_471380 [Ilyonectria robusta]
MPSIHHLRARATDMPADDSSDSMINLMLVVLGIAFVALILISILFFLRRSRRMQLMREQAQGEKDDGLPPYYDNKRYNNPRGLTIETTHNGRSSVFIVDRNGRPMLTNPNSPPHSPDNVPEIHITFPDEQDDQGRPKSGRVLVVRVGDNSAVGLEPMNDEQLPAYEKEAKGQFYSIDMNQIGGLKEKDRSQFQ